MSTVILGVNLLIPKPFQLLRILWKLSFWTCLQSWVMRPPVLKSHLGSICSQQKGRICSIWGAEGPHPGFLEADTSQAKIAMLLRGWRTWTFTCTCTCTWKLGRDPLKNKKPQCLFGIFHGMLLS